jgi:hypothetical protein
MPAKADSMADLGPGQDVAEDHRGDDEPEKRHVDTERSDIEVADQKLRQPVFAGVPCALREAVGDEQRGAARDEQHAQRDEEGRDLEPRHEPAVDVADEGGHRERDEEGHFQRQRSGVEQRPHDDGRQAEKRTDRQVELARRHQQRHGERHESQFDREGQGVADVQYGKELGVDRREDDKQSDQQHERAEFGF